MPSAQKNKKISLASLCVIAGTLLISGCTTTPIAKDNAPEEKTPEKTVQALSNERWSLLLANKIEETYQLIPPSIQATMTKEAYLAQYADNGTKWTAFEVFEPECPTPERCTVDVKVTIKLNIQNFRGREVSSITHETWVKEDNKWWFYQK